VKKGSDASFSAGLVPNPIERFPKSTVSAILTVSILGLLKEG